MTASSAALRFARLETPAALREVFGAIREALRLFTGDDDLDVHTQVLWTGLHGLITLMRGGCLPRETHQRRIALLIDRSSV